MKLLSSLSGTAAVVVSSDDVSPPNGVMAGELIDFVADLYKFAVKPVIPDGVAPSSIPVRAFQSGLFVKDDLKIPLFQLGLFPNGYVVTAATTDLADMIVDDLLDKLDSAFGYRNNNAKKQRMYQSIIAVEFGEALEHLIGSLYTIENMLDMKIPRPQAPFKIKRLGFGAGEIFDPAAPLTIEYLKMGDFTIERRSGEEYTENRYFCTAPARTSTHTEILEEIERHFS